MRRNLLVIFIFAFLIRLISLNQSLWLDEATTAKVTQLSFGQILTQFSPTDFHPPLYYLFMKVWASIFGISEIALRFPSIIFSLLTGWYVYKIGNLLGDSGFPDRSPGQAPPGMTKIGFWSAAFFLFNPLIIYYSQEARMYLMVTFMLTASLYYFLVIMGSRNPLSRAGKSGMTRELLLFNIFTGLSFLMFYASVFFIATFYIYVVYKAKHKLLPFLLPGFVLSFIIVSPLLYQQLLNSRQALLEVKNWSLVLGTVTVKNLLLIPLKFTTGRITFYPKILYYAIGGFWTAMIAVDIVKGYFKNKLLLYFFVLPLVLGLIFSTVAPMMQYFRFIYLIPVMSVLISLGGKNEMSKFLILIIFSLLSLIYLVFPTFHREDWKNLSLYVSKQQSPVYMILSASDPLKYYAKNMTTKDIKTIFTDELTTDIMIIPYVTDVHGVDYRQALLIQRYSKRETVTMRGLTAERWSHDP